MGFKACHADIRINFPSPRWLEMSRAGQEVYQIVLVDNASGHYSYGVPEEGQQPRVLYTSVADAKRALHVLTGKFSSFTPVAYGQAFPFEGVSFEQELVKSGFAAYGWATIEAESEEDESERVALGLLRLRLSGAT